MTRIIAGARRGHRLAVPQGPTRPTSDRAREALFSSVDAVLDLDGAFVLDLYAGSGALGLEALSRGAAWLMLVESDPRAVTVLRRNVSALGLPGAHVVADRVERFAARPAPEGGVDLVLADPPYALGAAELATNLATLAARGWFAPGALVVVERSTRDPAWVWPKPLVALRSRAYGEATLWYGRAS